MDTKYSKKYNSQFLKLYKTLEALETNEINKYRYLLNKHRNEIDTFRYMRNTLAHNLINGEDPFIVSKSVIDLLQQYLDEVNQKVYSFSVKTKDIKTVEYCSTLEETLRIMGNNNYSNIPIVDSNFRVIGIVSSDVVIDILNKKAELEVEMMDKFNKYSSYFDLKNTDNGFHLFVNKDMDLYELDNVIDGYKYSKNKCNIILVTSDGTKSGRLLGLLTPWDLLKNS